MNECMDSSVQELNNCYSTDAAQHKVQDWLVRPLQQLFACVGDKTF
jgi:hypothetical protein